MSLDQVILGRDSKQVVCVISLCLLLYFLECEVTITCDAEHEVYSHVDCDGDGILDHACRTTNHQNHWLILSSEGCRNCWGTSNRCVSECPAAWPSKGNENIQLLGLWLNSFFNHTNVFIKNVKKDQDI